MRNIIFTLLFSLSMLTSGFAMAAETTDSATPTSYLFIQVTPDATLKQVANKPNQYQLILKNLNNQVEYFADRPVRESGIISLDKFLTLWQKSFAEVPPNAGLVGIQISPKGEQHYYVLELSKPEYNAETNTLTYAAKTVGNDNPLPKEIQFNGAAVFIDSYCASCGGGGF